MRTSPGRRAGAWLLLLVVLVACEGSRAPSASAGPAPLPAHSHNDYWRSRPLDDAVELGFRSVEADVFPAERDLLVAHDTWTCRADRTLESLYLTPLRERLAATGSVLGTPLREHGGFLLLVDCKKDGPRCLRLLDQKLRPLRPWLTRREGGRLIPGELTVILSGARPEAELRRADPAYAFLDARPGELAAVDAGLAPLVSASWRRRFQWRGKGPMPVADTRRLAADVAAATAGGHLLRYWALPHDETVWRTLRRAGVSLLQADDLDRLAAFLRSEPDAPWIPAHARR